MKKPICALLAVICLLSSLAMPACADEIECAWCVKRAKDGGIPSINPNASELLASYHSYYVDEAADANDKVLYLTFDAGYENGNVEKTLDILKKQNVKASFFVLSHLIKSEEALIKRMTDEGHQVCNHTAKHKNLAKLSEQEITKEIKGLEEIYRQSTGQELARFFRPPEGKYNKTVLKTAQSMGYTTVFWSLAYADWCDEVAPSDEKAKEILKNNTHNGAIILLHPTSSTNARILEEMIEYWKSEGYRFASLEELRQK